MQDLEAYLRLCETTTPGKWEVVSRGIGDSTVLVLASFNGISSDDDCLLITRQCKGLEDVRPAKVDARFCAEAHEGWPKTIRRAMAAEEENRKLWSRVAKLEAVVKTAKAWRDAEEAYSKACALYSRNAISDSRLDEALVIRFAAEDALKANLAILEEA